jgi:NIMA (never in mitosis gene a)-related kinase
LDEVRILASITHPNIIAYKQAFFDNKAQTLNIVMEYADDGDLEKKIQSHVKKKTKFSENQIWQILIQIVKGLKTLHDMKIMHRDLKSANIFLMKDGTVKLGDLNVSKIFKSNFAHTQTGTPYYTPPEIWENKIYDFKADIWSLGCIIYELSALKHPFNGKNFHELHENIKHGNTTSYLGNRDPIPKLYTKDLSDIIDLLLKTNPDDRPSCENILSFPIIQQKDHSKEMNKFDVKKLNLMSTIKLPKNISEINKFLPNTKISNIFNITESTKIHKTKKHLNPIFSTRNRK